MVKGSTLTVGNFLSLENLNVTSSLDSGDLIIGVFLDLKKHLTLQTTTYLKKLSCYGIRVCTIKWVESYLTDRFTVCYS